MRIDNITITNHAFEQFKARLFNVHPSFSGNHEDFITRLLKKATKERRGDPFKRVERILKHAEQDYAEFYVTPCGWRFVIAEKEDGRMVVVTCERVKPQQNQIGKEAEGRKRTARNAKESQKSSSREPQGTPTATSALG